MSTTTNSEPSTDATFTDEDDPHAPKIAVDDPRLQAHRPRSRVLKMGPVIGCIAGLLAIGGTVVVYSVNDHDERKVAREPAKVPVTAPSVPAFIQEAPATPKAPPAPVLLTASAPPPVVLTQELVQRPDPREEQARQQEQARRVELDRQEAEARGSGLFFAGGSASASAAPPPVVAQPASLSAGGLPALTSAPRGTADSWDPNLQTRKNAFLDDPQAHPDYLPTTLQQPISPYEVKATTLIPATLLTGINSDLPGPIIAQVRERVYDTVTGRHLLIPQGARLLASYDSMVAWGQERVLLCWNRIIFPNGSSINLACMPAADLQGQAGLADEVDNHWDRLLGAVALSTVLSLGAQAAAGDPTGYQQNLAQRAAGNAAGQINSAGQAVVQRQINIQPTITVRPGFGVNVIVTRDMILEPYVD